MNSRHDLPQFYDWVEWRGRSSAQAPAQPGVYMFRLDRSIPRLFGDSDLLYIGGTKSLSRRFKQHRIARSDGTGVGLVLQHIENRNLGLVQIAWHPCNSTKEAFDFEWTHLAEYKDDHLELPPLNSNQPKRRKGQALWALREVLVDLLGKPVNHKTVRDFIEHARQRISK